MPIDKRNCILLFVKAPLPGTVKTRLSDRLAPEAILALYKGFVTDLLATLQTTGHDIRIFYDPPDKKDVLVDWLGSGLFLYPQTGSDLGKRMEAAFIETFAAGYTHAVLIGSDIPDLPISILDAALDCLDRYPAVIGPSTDGGYYLIGFESEGFLKEAFDRITWSTERVFASTMDRFAIHSRQIHVLPRWQDVDTYDDLLDLVRRMREQPDRLPDTRRALVESGLL